MKKSIFLALLATAAIAGCKKDEKASEKELADKRWKVTGGTVNVFGTTLPILESMDECDRDNIWITKADHTNGYESGAIKCDSSEATSGVSGTWKLENKTTLVLTGADILNTGSTAETKMTIIKSDGKTLQVSMKMPIPADSGMTIPLTIDANITFTAQ